MDRIKALKETEKRKKWAPLVLIANFLLAPVLFILVLGGMVFIGYFFTVILGGVQYPDLFIGFIACLFVGLVFTIVAIIIGDTAKEMWVGAKKETEEWVNEPLRGRDEDVR